ncbi:MAG: Alcohol dehydrogenase zinc-binding domain protein [Deltaproteobacteria bacterium]|nr:Alcohol dehydrogenase zinc-binding domain protein [Deltaproteobacteria bacterium]
MGQICRAGVFTGDGRYEVREFPIPDPAPGGALLQVEAVGLCGSDLGQLHGLNNVPNGMYPVVPGHEIVGRVVRLAPDAALGVSEGDRIGVDEVLSTEPLRCYGVTDMTGERRLGLWGGYGEFMQIFPGTVLHRFTTDAPAAELTLFEPLANALNWLGAVPIAAGQSVVVQGPGHQGLAVVAAALAAGANPVIVTGTSSDQLRLETARQIGAHHVVDVQQRDAKTVVAEITTGRGADVVFDVTPVPRTVPLCFDLVRAQGTVVLAGLKEMRSVELVTDWIPLKGLRVVGGMAYSRESMTEAVRLLNVGAINTAALRGDVFDLDHIDEAMGLLTRSLPGRDAVRVGLVHRHG